MESLTGECVPSEYDFLINAINILETRFDNEDVKWISKTIRYWWNIVGIFNQRVVEVKKSLEMGEQELSEFEFCYGIIQLYTLETIKQAECSAISMVAGFYESSFILLRSAIEKMVNALYFTVDRKALDTWLSGKLRISVTGKNGMIARLCNEHFLREKVGLPLPPLISEFSEYLKSAYGNYSKVVHGVRIGATDFLKPYIVSKGEPVKFTKMVREIESEYINTFREIIRGTLDLLGIIYIMSLIISTKGRILKERFCNEVLQEMSPHFTRMHDFIETLYRLEEKRKDKKKRHRRVK